MKTAEEYQGLSRRNFLSTVGSAALIGALGGLANPLKGETKEKDFIRGKAKNCIMIWLGGGMGQIDTFDPKRVGVPMENVPGSAYPAISTNVPGVKVCEHLRNCASLMDRMTVVRTVNNDVIDEHAAAVIRVHTGRPTSGTIQYPSIGSIISHELGAVDPLVPAYVVVGYPNVARDPGFLGPNSGYLYVTDTVSGPNGLSRPSYISSKQQSRREQTLDQFRKNKSVPSYLRDYDDMLSKSLKLAGPGFMGAFDLERESTSLRESYGGEFGQRCLLARRLLERGVRFIEVSHNLNFSNGTGWDVHFGGLKNQHILIQEVDLALSALIRDLDESGKLDETLIVVGTEFGRPADFDSGGGRGHYGDCFSLVLAGGGLNHKGAYGQTDDLAQQVVENPVSIPDFHATIYATLGINPAKELFTENRPVPITDGGKPIGALFG
jgi:hypothetical protein